MLLSAFQYPGSGGRTSPADYRLNNGNLIATPTRIVRPTDLPADPTEKMNLLEQRVSLSILAPIASPDPS